jgi:hypothetical protein
MSELDEVRHLLTLATFPGLQQTLRNYEQSLVNQEQMELAPPFPETASASTAEAPTVSIEPQPKVAPLAPRPVFGGRDQIYTPILDFAWDQGGYNSETVTIYVELPDVGSVKDQVHCSFTTTSFDLIVSSSTSPSHLPL